MYGTFQWYTGAIAHAPSFAWKDPSPLLPVEILLFLPGQAKVPYSLSKIPSPSTSVRKAVLFFYKTLIM